MSAQGRSMRAQRVSAITALTMATYLAVACGATVTPTNSSQGVAASTDSVPGPSTPASFAPGPTIAPFKLEKSVEFKPTVTFPKVPSAWSLDDDTAGTFI